MDFLKLERSRGGPENILILTDHFTRYAQAIPTTNQTARTTAKALFEKFIVHYGFPERLHSDQGRNFESEVIRNLCELAGMEKTRTTPYHPSGNGMCERFNRTLLHMLGTLDDHQKANWKDYVAPVVHAYNTTKHNSTGFSPFYLMFGRHPRLAVDVYFGHQPNGRRSKGQSKFIKDLSSRLGFAYDLATKNSKAAQARQKKVYDRSPIANKIEIGDEVLVRNFTPSGKLDNYWEGHIYIVKAKPNSDIPVYVVQRKGAIGRERTLHRNNLKPCPFSIHCMDVQPTLGESCDVGTNGKPTPRRSTRTRRKPKWMNQSVWQTLKKKKKKKERERKV